MSITETFYCRAINIAMLSKFANLSELKKPAKLNKMYGFNENVKLKAVKVGSLTVYSINLYNFHQDIFKMVIK